MELKSPRTPKTTASPAPVAASAKNVNANSVNIMFGGSGGI